ncbi:sarcosine oxidase subunit alpha [Metarhizobium album]|uniref:Sarcosine oxidase subunit alpha n=1 Tax=Metarhizobium album TaxID=2182425 RepID=A0A2U2DUU2_9HYPH|nr:sarcosine oxidase subunit alpha family protein [Rhizobium album]PWE57061.1 sarcosine oxidase subunit alpha [Rhizobium album]
MSAHRLSSGGLVDRSRSLGFSFDGLDLKGYEGDTLASALLANDQLLVGRSFKYHRPRGIVTAGSAEPNALVMIGKGARTEPNTRATVAELYNGLVATSQNRWPSLKYDIGSLNSLLSPFLGAGFYYKTFMWPAAFWEKVYEPFIRRAAGLGKAVMEADPDRYEKAWAHCDLLVVGAGPAGLMAALTAARAGLRVILADEGFRLGGSLLSERVSIGGTAPSTFVETILSELAGFPWVTLMPRTTVFGWYDDNVFGAVEKVQKHIALPSLDLPVERLWRIVARRAIMATGAEERPLVFGGNDRPGVMTAGAGRTYLNRYGVAVGRKVAVFTNGGSGYQAARDLAAQGIDVAAVIDGRPAAGDNLPNGIRLIQGGGVVKVKGRHRVGGLLVERSGFEESIDCDALLMSGGWSPIIHLACQRGAKPYWSDEKQAFLAPDVGRQLLPAGSASGLSGIGACLRDGVAKALSALASLDLTATSPDVPDVEGEYDASFAPLWYVPGARDKAFVDFQNDVHVKDLGLAQREGFGHIEHTKRYTTSGMATDQGKLGNVNATGIIAGMKGVSPAEIGVTTFRPFYTPVSFGAMAGTSRGEHSRPVRRSPLHGWAKKNGAVFVEAGLWHRSSWFPRDGEKGWRQSVDREVMNARTNVGLCDVSTLGKIEVFGNDAAEFLNRIYSNAFLKLPVGRARYGLMLREDGIVYDDGTTSRLAENHFFVTTTTAYAAEVMTHMEYCAQVLWPDLDVRFVSSSDQWAQMSLVGPKARLVLQQVVEDDVSNEAFPFLAVREVTLKGGLRARLFRISFSGELAYELAVPAGYGEAVADALMEAGRPHDICAYGVEALNVLRIEKGHVTHNELNGTTTPDDVGLGKMFSVNKPDFIGKRLSSRFGLTAADRLQLVGLKPVDKAKEIKAGAHLLKEGAAPSMTNDQGHVTSACFSPALGHPIALALLKSGRERFGEKIVVWDKLRGEEFVAEVCSPVFIDPDSQKLHQ